MGAGCSRRSRAPQRRSPQATEPSQTPATWRPTGCSCDGGGGVARPAWGSGPIGCPRAVTEADGMSPTAQRHDHHAIQQRFRERGALVCAGCPDGISPGGTASAPETDSTVRGAAERARGPERGARSESALGGRCREAERSGSGVLVPAPNETRCAPPPRLDPACVHAAPVATGLGGAPSFPRSGAVFRSWHHCP